MVSGRTVNARMWLFIFVVSNVVLSGCIDNVDGVKTVNYSKTTSFDNEMFSSQIELRDQFDQAVTVFQLSDPMKIVFQLKNDTQFESTMTFPSGQRLLLVVTAKDSTEILSDVSSYFSYIQAITTETIDGGEFVEFTLTLDSLQLPVGEYRIRAAVSLADVTNENLIDDISSQFEASTVFELID